MWKSLNFTLTGKNFVKPAYSVILYHSVEKCYKMRSHFLRKNQHFFRHINVLLKKEVNKGLIWRKIFEHVRVLNALISRNFCKKWWEKIIEFHPYWKKFRETNIHYNSVLIALISRNFCKKRWEKISAISTLLPPSFIFFKESHNVHSVIGT